MAETDRTELLLAFLLLNQMKGASQSEKALQLNLAGFSNVEIADILQTTPQLVSDALYNVRRVKPSRRVNRSRRRRAKVRS